MAVNGLATGLIVFKIIKLFLEIKAATGDTTTYRRIIFVIIESGMTLFVIQLVRMLLFDILVPTSPVLNYVVVIGELFNVMIRFVHFYFFCFTEEIYLSRASHQL